MKILSITPIVETDIELIHDSKEYAKTRIAWLKEQLANTDYKTIKYAEGEMTEEEFAPIRIQRATWREEIRQFEQTL